MLHLKLVRSSVPHARIAGIDTRAALASDGVRAVLAGADFPVPFGILPVSQDEHALCADKVRFVGDPVAAVVASEELIAEEAARLIQVSYEPLTKTAEALRDGWLDTGDTYFRDEDGYYHYCGRSDDMLKVGGMWCSPIEIESRLVSHPSVLEAAVAGLADESGHSPGHARGHLCLVEPASKAAIVGDMVAGIGTVVIDPPEGDMAEYLRQLARLRDEFELRTLYPEHGPPIVDGRAKLDAYIQHRTWRERKLLSALPADGDGLTLSELVLNAYDDVQSFVLPLAERNTLAMLEKLVCEGRARRKDHRYTALRPAPGTLDSCDESLILSR